MFPVGFVLSRGFRINKSRRKKSGIIPADRTYTHIYSQAGRIKYIIIIHIPSLSLTVIHLAIVPVQLVFPYLYMNPSHMHGCSDILYVRTYLRTRSQPYMPTVHFGSLQFQMQNCIFFSLGAFGQCLFKRP